MTSVRLSMFNHVFKQSIRECKYRYFFFYPQREVSEHVHRCSFDENSYHPRNGFYDRDSSLPVQEGHRQNHRHHRSLPPRNLQSDGRRFQRGLCSGSPHYAVGDRGVHCFHCGLNVRGIQTLICLREHYEDVEHNVFNAMDETVMNDDIR